MNRAILLRLLGFLLLLAVVTAVFQALSPNFASADNISAILRHMSADGLAALGLTFVIVVRKSDLSFPGIASFGAMTAGWLIAGDHSLLVSIAGGVAVGVICGAVNGIAVGLVKLPDIVTTIAVGSIAYGLSYLYSNGSTISDNFMTSGITDINDQTIAYIDEPVFFMLLLNVLAWLVLHRSRYGRAFYATGENPRSALFSGISVRLCVLLAFVISGAMSCWAGVLHCAEAGQADVDAGSTFLMPAYASVYLGAALFGTASVPATFAGTLLISTMLNGFTLLSVPYYYSDAIISVVLIAAISIFDPRIGASLRRLRHITPHAGARS
jgi:ribose transport system permease protein